MCDLEWFSKIQSLKYSYKHLSYHHLQQNMATTTVWDVNLTIAPVLVNYSAHVVMQE